VGGARVVTQRRGGPGRFSEWSGPGGVVVRVQRGDRMIESTFCGSCGRGGGWAEEGCEGARVRASRGGGVVGRLVWVRGGPGGCARSCAGGRALGGSGQRRRVTGVVRCVRNSVEGTARWDSQGGMVGKTGTLLIDEGDGYGSGAIYLPGGGQYWNRSLGGVVRCGGMICGVRRGGAVCERRGRGLGEVCVPLVGAGVGW